MKMIKQWILLAAALSIALPTLAHSSMVTINFKNGKTVVYNQSEINSITFAEAAKSSSYIFSGVKSFNGVNDGIDLGTALPSRMQGDFTIEMDVKPGSNQQTHADILDFNHRDRVGLVIQQVGDDLNNFVFAIGNGNGGASITYRLQTGAWQHVVFQRADTEIRLYVNDALVETKPCFPGNIYYLPDSSATVGYNKTYGRYFKGDIKNLSIR